MPNWKKVIVSGSNAILNHITASGNVSGSAISTASFGTYIGDGSQLSGISTTPFPFTGDAQISGSLIVSQSYTVGDTNSTALRLFGSGSVSQSGIFEVEGSAGPLFSVQDGLDGILMEVNNISGLPLFQVSSSNEVFINRGNLTSGVNTATASFANFSGSFQGDGTNLNLASNTTIPSSDPFPFTGDAQITGSLIVSGSGGLKVKGPFELSMTGSSGNVPFKIKTYSDSTSDNIIEIKDDGGTYDLFTLNNAGQITIKNAASSVGARFYVQEGGTSNTHASLGIVNNTGHLSIKNNNGNRFAVDTKADNRSYLVGLTGNATMAIGKAAGGTAAPSEANTNTISIFNGTNPTSVQADGFAFFSNDVNSAAGTASPTFLTEDGTTIQLGTTSSFTAISASSYISASAFIGDGSQLTNLNTTTPTLAQVVTAGATAAGDVQITGSLIISGAAEFRGVEDYDTNVVIGKNATSTAQYSVVIGKDAGISSGGSENVVIGHSANLANNALYNVVIGEGAYGSGAGPIAIGQGATAAGEGIAIGWGASVSDYRGIAIGRGATAGLNQLQIGNSTYEPIISASLETGHIILSQTSSDGYSQGGLEVHGSGSKVFEVIGSEGDLFTITDNLTTGSLFAVKDISGFPLLDVTANSTTPDTVTVGQSNLILDSGSLQVTGSTGISGSLQIQGIADVSASIAAASTPTTAGSTAGRVVFTTTGGALTTESGFEYNSTTNQLSVDSLNVIHLTSSFITSSRIHTSGSNIFGDDTTDTQTLIGTTKMTGSAQITGSLTGTPGTTNNLTASYAITASHALSSLTATTATTASFALTSSLVIQQDAVDKVVNTRNINFTGNAVSLITGAPNPGASVIVAINTGSAVEAFPFTGDAQITGSLIISASHTSQSLSVIGSGSTVFNVIGSEGTLFSIDDDLDGIIFTANDRSGLPVLEASASGEVYIGKAPQSLYTTAVISSTTAATTQSIFGLSTSSYGGAFFDYTVQSGSDARAGSIMSVWNGSNISFTETTTTDIGDTTDFNVIVHISQSQAQIASHASRAGYNIKTIIRSI